MKSTRKIIISITIMFLLNGIALAGPADSPLPLLDGKKAKHIFTVTGVVNWANRVATSFVCTSTEKTKDFWFGVEVFSHAGILVNDVSSGDGALFLLPGRTRTISTQDTAIFSDDDILNSPGDINQGSARIVSHSNKIVCTALIVESENRPPLSMAPLPVFKKTKQQGD